MLFFSLDPLRGYQGEDIEVVLPKNLTVYNIEWLSVWCVQYKHNFGHVLIPKDLDVPPALGQTKITVNRDHFSSDRWELKAFANHYNKLFAKMFPRKQKNYSNTRDFLNYSKSQFFPPFYHF